MRIDKFYKDSFVLTVSNFVTGMIGFIFSIILSRELGTEGLGLYGLIMPVYSLLLCLVSEGLITAISKVTAVYYSKKDFRNIHRTVTTVFFFIFLWSILIALLVYIGSFTIGSYIIRDARSVSALKVICPALLFVPMSAIIKGYFYGVGQFKIAAFIDVAEKIFRVVVFMGIISILSYHDVDNTVTAAYIALAVGEFTSLILLYSFYKINKKKTAVSISKPQNRLQLLYNACVISFPLCVNGFVSSILSTASFLLLPRRLMHAGIPYDDALSLIGKFTGMALTVTRLPLIVVASISVVLVPDLSLSLSKKNYMDSERRISQVLRISFLVAISTFIIAQSSPEIWGRLFYRRTDLDNFIKFASICSVFSYIALPTYGMLNGLGKAKIILRNSLIVSLLELILIYALTGIPSVNIYGYGITIIVSSLTSLLLNLYEIRKVCFIRFSVKEFIKYAGIVASSYCVLKMLDTLVPDTLIVYKALILGIAGIMTVFGLYRLMSQKYFFRKESFPKIYKVK